MSRTKIDKDRRDQLYAFMSHVLDFAIHLMTPPGGGKLYENWQGQLRLMVHAFDDRVEEFIEATEIPRT